MEADQALLWAALAGLFVTYVLLAIVTLADLLLGIYALRRAGHSLSARLLATYLILQPLSWGILLADVRVTAPGFHFDGLLEETGWGRLWGIPLAAAMILSALPALLVAFAFQYLAPARRPRLGWLAMTGLLLPSVVLPFVTLQGVAWSNDDDIRRGLASLVLGGAAYGILGTLGTAILFLLRARRASSTLQRRRLRYMTWTILIPTCVGLAVGLAFVALAGGRLFQTESTGAAMAGVVVLAFVPVAVVLVPALGMAYGLLRFRIMDWDEHIRTGIRATLRTGGLAALFVLVFFGLTEAAQRLLVLGSKSQIVGLIGAGLLALGLRPLERAADRFATRLVPPHQWARKIRRQDLYRANYEELTADGGLSDQERRMLKTLGHGLGLEPSEAAAIESQAEAERVPRAV